MLIIGCDFHTRYQQIAMAREETGELLVERRLDHASGEAHAFYRSLQSSQESVRVGIEATGPIHWRNGTAERDRREVSLSLKNPQSLRAKRTLSNKYQKIFRLSPIPPERDQRSESQLPGLINTTAFRGRLTR
jgi:hypothetical protein